MGRKADLSGTGVFIANRALGKVSLTAGAQNGITRRTRVAEEGSLRVRFPGPAARQLQAVLINTAGGMTGGDRFAIDATLGTDAALLLTTASAEKVYRSLGEDASLDIALRVERGASLAWLPRETILFDQSRLARSIEIDLAEDASLLLAEAIVFGRSGMGETVEHGRLFDRWRVRRGGRLVYAEQIKLDGAIGAELKKPAIGNDHIAVATILMSPADDHFVAALRAAEPNLRGEVGASSWNGLTVARFCARDGEALRHDMMAALNLAMDGPLPKLWLN